MQYHSVEFNARSNQQYTHSVDCIVICKLCPPSLSSLFYLLQNFCDNTITITQGGGVVVLLRSLKDCLIRERDLVWSLAIGGA